MSPESRRAALSLLSLLLLAGLLWAWFLVRGGQPEEGKLGSITTGEVRVSVGPPAPELGAASGAATATAAPEATAPAAPQRGRGPLVTEVLAGRDDPPAARANDDAGATPATATSESAGGSGAPLVTGLAPGSSVADAGPPEPFPGLPRSFVVRDPEGLSLPPGSATATPGDGGSPDDAEDVGPPGHRSHLAMPGIVAPGAYETGGILVANAGTVAFNYSLSMSTAGDAGFAATLKLRIYLRVGASCNYPGAPAAGDDFLPLTGDQVGTEIYVGDFATGNKFGNPDFEVFAGDRFLAPGESEVLCMEVFFPWGAGNSNQGKSVNGTFIFTAKSPE